LEACSIADPARVNGRFRQRTHRPLRRDGRAYRLFLNTYRDGCAGAAIFAHHDPRPLAVISQKSVQSLDAASIIKDAEKELQSPARRLFGKRVLTLGGLALLSG